MKLNRDWLTDGLIDFEYKKYILLAYMKETMSSFGERKLYPFLSELVFHYNNLLRIKENKTVLHENFPKQVSKADFEKLKISYERIVKDDEMMKVIEDVIHFSLPRIQEGLETGAEIYEEIARNIIIEPIGIAPLFKGEGYLFICEHHHADTQIFRYQITTFNAADETYKGISTEFLEVKQRNIVNTLEKIKMEMVKRYTSLPNPATFAAFVKMQCPMEETLLPVTKRMLIQHLEQAA